MARADLDRLQKERFGDLKGKLSNLPTRRSQALSKIFIGERVLKTIDQPKLVLDGYRLERILSVLPFSPVTYTISAHGASRTRMK